MFPWELQLQTKNDTHYRGKHFYFFRLKPLQYLLPWRRLQDIIEAVEKNELSKEEYPYIKLPPGEGAGSLTLKKPRSVRTFRYRWPDEPRYPLWSPALPCILLSLYLKNNSCHGLGIAS